jgi:hypothetical protein
MCRRPPVEKMTSSRCYEEAKWGLNMFIAADTKFLKYTNPGVCLWLLSSLVQIVLLYFYRKQEILVVSRRLRFINVLQFSIYRTPLRWSLKQLHLCFRVKYISLSPLFNFSSSAKLVCLVLDHANAFLAKISIHYFLDPSSGLTNLIWELLLFRPLLKFGMILVRWDCLLISYCRLYCVVIVYFFSKANCQKR